MILSRRWFWRVLLVVYLAAVAYVCFASQGSLPKFSVSWYAKGGVFDSPTIIGVGEGSSSEAVLPLNAGVYRQIARGIMAEGGAVEGVTITGNTFYVREEADIDRIAGALARKIRREGGALK